MITKEERDWITQQTAGMNKQAAEKFAEDSVDYFTKKRSGKPKKQDFAKINMLEVFPLLDPKEVREKIIRRIK